MARARTAPILREGSRVYVEEQLFRADVEQRLFRAASACAFDWGLQPRPALKGIHPPAVAAMNGRSSTLTQALVLRARRNIRPEETQMGIRFVVPPLCVPTLAIRSVWKMITLGRTRKTCPLATRQHGPSIAGLRP